MIKYINTLEDTILQMHNNTNIYKDFISVVENYDRWVFIASGSSYNAILIASSLLKDKLNIYVEVYTPTEILYTNTHLSEECIYIVISQSGYSSNSIDAAKYLIENGYNTVSMSTDIKSPLSILTPTSFDIGCGIEDVGYVTKGVIALIYFMLEVSYMINNEVIPYQEYIEKIKYSRDKFFDFYNTNKRDLVAMTNVYFCGIGISKAIGMEGALKIGETSSKPSFAYDIEEFIHGPNMSITPNDGIIVFNLPRATERINTLYSQISILSGRCYLMDEEEFEMTPFAYLPWIQLLAYNLTEDLNNWKKLPMYYQSQEIQNSKVEGYIEKEDIKFK